MSDALPRSVYFRPTQKPPPFFRLVTFNIDKGASGAEASAAIERMWTMLGRLSDGIVDDLAAIRRPGEAAIRVDPANLSFKLGFGARLWDEAAHVPPIAGARPFDLPPLQAEGPFTSLKWADGAARDAAQTDLTIALHADTELGVARAVVELQKVIDDASLPLKMVCFFSGLHRDDGRSWIDFHDGINNMRSGAERRMALEIVQEEQPWLLGGTKMAFMKIAIDMQGWRRLSRARQELMVGRDKLSGCPVVGARMGGEGPEPKLDLACPAGRPIDVSSDGDLDLITASAPADLLAQLSHIHRANRSRLPPEQDSAQRIFRQGYEFVDSPEGGGVRVGLNFVSFQRSFLSILSILALTRWMGDANFGGPVDQAAFPQFELMRIVAGGFFVIPPLRDSPFPGASVFDAS